MACPATVMQVCVLGTCVGTLVAEHGKQWPTMHLCSYLQKTYKGRTLYNRVVVGGPRARQYKAGDCVQVHTKPIVVGVVKGFLADKIHEGDLDTGR